MNLFKKLLNAFSNTDDNKVDSAPNTPRIQPKNKLEIGDIILLYWHDTSLSNSFPSYFEYDYNINPQKHRNQLINLGLLSNQKSERSLAKLKVTDLKLILKEAELPISGKKDALIQRIMDNFETLETKVPSSLCLTAAGQKVLADNFLLVKAHKDKYLNAIEFSQYLQAHPNKSYEELKTLILNKEIKNSIKSMHFGVVRNAHAGLADMYAEMEQHQIAMKHYLMVILLDCSGLDNSYNFTNNPIYYEGMVNSYHITKLRNTAEECDLDDYNVAFQEAKDSIKALRRKIFLTDKDFLFIQQNLLTEDAKIIEKYLKKYKKFTFDYYIK